MANHNHDCALKVAHSFLARRIGIDRWYITTPIRMMQEAEGRLAFVQAIVKAVKRNSFFRWSAIAQSTILRE